MSRTKRNVIPVSPAPATAYAPAPALAPAPAPAPYLVSPGKPAEIVMIHFSICNPSCICNLRRSRRKGEKEGVT